MNKYKIIRSVSIFLIMFVIIIINIKYFDKEEVTNIEIKIKNLSDVDLYILWNKTTFGTSVNNIAYDELDIRKYFKEQELESEKRDIRFFNEFIKYK